MVVVATLTLKPLPPSLLHPLCLPLPSPVLLAMLLGPGCSASPILLPLSPYVADVLGVRIGGLSLPFGRALRKPKEILRSVRCCSQLLWP